MTFLLLCSPSNPFCSEISTNPFCKTKWVARYSFFLFPRNRRHAAFVSNRLSRYLLVETSFDWRSMKSLYSFSASSLANPYLFCSIPKRISSCPSISGRLSSVSLPHFYLTSPLISVHVPFNISAFMFPFFWPHYSLRPRDPFPFSGSLSADARLPAGGEPTSTSNSLILILFSLRLQRVSALNNPDQNYNNGDDEQNMDESANRISAD